MYVFSSPLKNFFAPTLEMEGVTFEATSARCTTFKIHIYTNKSKYAHFNMPMDFQLLINLPRFGGLGGVDRVNSQFLGQIFQILDGLSFGLVVRHL